MAEPETERTLFIPVLFPDRPPTDEEKREFEVYMICAAQRALERWAAHWREFTRVEKILDSLETP